MGFTAHFLFALPHPTVFERLGVEFEWRQLRMICTGQLSSL